MMLKLDKNRSGLLIAAVAASAMVLSACGSDATSTPSSNAPSSAPTSAAGSAPSSATDGSTEAGASTPASSGGSTAGPIKIAAVIKGLDNPFFQTMEDGINAAASTSGSTVSVQAAQAITDTTGQADKLIALVQQDFDCYVVNPISGTNLVQGLAQLAGKNVPVVNIDSPVDAAAAAEGGVKLATYIGTDNNEAGATAGAEMLKIVGSGKVAIIGGIAGDVTSGARVDGFTSAVSGLEIVTTVAADWERQKALTTATDIINSTPDIKGFFAANDDMGLGIARAVANAGKTGQIAVISVDGNKDALEAVKAGEMTATVAQYPYAIGELGIQACEKAAAGETLPENVKAPVALVTKTDADAAIAAFPAPFAEYDNPLDGK